MQQNLDHALQSLLDGVAVVDPEGRIVVFNTALEALTGIAATRAIGQPLEAVFAENAQVAELRRKVLDLEQPHVDLDATLARRDAPPLPVGISVSPVQDSAGDVVGVTVVVRDLSRLRELETQVRRASTLNQFGALAAGLAHEIKNPLAGIRGAAQLLAGELCGREHEAHTSVITREVDRINTLVEQLLDMARAPHLKIAAVNIHEVLDTVIWLESQVQGRPPITWVKEYDPSLPELRADADQLQQLFLNLVRNAAEALAATGAPGSISMSTAFGTLHRRLGDGLEKSPRQVEPMISIKVHDSGPGIPRAALAAVFTPFYTTKDHGTGLGLMLSQQIVERHAGLLSIDAPPAGGTTVTVMLPLHGPQRHG